jgi:hypothetical protein
VLYGAERATRQATRAADRLQRCTVGTDSLSR